MTTRLGKAPRKTKYRSTRREAEALTGFYDRDELRNTRESERRYEQARRRAAAAYRGTSTSISPEET